MLGQESGASEPSLELPTKEARSSCWGDTAGSMQRPLPEVTLCHSAPDA